MKTVKKIVPNCIKTDIVYQSFQNSPSNFHQAQLNFCTKITSYPTCAMRMRIRVFHEVAEIFVLRFNKKTL